MDRRRGRRRTPSSAAAAIAREWALQLVATAYLPMGRAEAELFLRGQTDRLLGVLFDEPLDLQPAHQVGTDLAGIGATSSEALKQTLQVLGDHLLDDLPTRPVAGRYRLTRLLAELAAGWADAVREDILAEQEAVHRAVDVAREGEQKADPPSNP
jgi:hypothetical protein